jgi:hypothetical protein
MSMMFISAAVLMVVLLYCAERSFGAEPAPTVSDLEVEAGTIGARVSFVLGPKLGEADVCICYGTEDAGESLIEWQMADSWGVTGGTNNLPMGPLEPGTMYCVRVLAENGGGTTWSESVWVRTGEMKQIEKKQVGTVVVIK